MPSALISPTMTSSKCQGLLSNHPCCIVFQVLDGPSDDLRYDALDTICALAMALGQDFTIFVPTICKVRHSNSPNNSGAIHVLLHSVTHVAVLC